MYIVLKTEGKRDEVDEVTVLMFDNREKAMNYCEENTDDPMNEKYWMFSEIIQLSHKYEIARYENHY